MQRLGTTATAVELALFLTEGCRGPCGGERKLAGATHTYTAVQSSLCRCCTSSCIAVAPKSLKTQHGNFSRFAIQSNSLFSIIWRTVPYHSKATKRFYVPEGFVFTRSSRLNPFQFPFKPCHIHWHSPIALWQPHAVLRAGVDVSGAAEKAFPSPAPPQCATCIPTWVGHRSPHLHRLHIRRPACRARSQRRRRASSALPPAHVRFRKAQPPWFLPWFCCVCSITPTPPMHTCSRATCNPHIRTSTGRR